jgi:hypothetical protein
VSYITNFLQAVLKPEPFTHEEQAAAAGRLEALALAHGRLTISSYAELPRMQRVRVQDIILPELINDKAARYVLSKSMPKENGKVGRGAGAGEQLAVLLFNGTRNTNTNLHYDVMVARSPIEVKCGHASLGTSFVHGELKNKDQFVREHTKTLIGNYSTLANYIGDDSTFWDLECSPSVAQKTNKEVKSQLKNDKGRVAKALLALTHGERRAWLMSFFSAMYPHRSELDVLEFVDTVVNLVGDVRFHHEMVSFGFKTTPDVDILLFNEDQTEFIIIPNGKLEALEVEHLATFGVFTSINFYKGSSTEARTMPCAGLHLGKNPSDTIRSKKV